MSQIKRKGGVILKDLLHKKITKKEKQVIESGFDLEMYETVFINCFIDCSKYANGNLKLSLYGTDVKTEETAYFADITLENNKIRLPENEIIVDNCFKPTLIPHARINSDELMKKIA